MGRKRLSTEVETEVIWQSMRRCCLCYGLNRDAAMKSGQIAHLDKKPSNNSLNNLAYLCLEHHDAYDSTTRQSKGLTIAEVKRYRDELYAETCEIRRQPVEIGEITVRLRDAIAGHYVRDGVDSLAELDVVRLNGNRFKVTGFAYWGTIPPSRPNIGQLDFEAILQDDRMVHQERLTFGTQDLYSVELGFGDEVLIVEETPNHGIHGMNVTFSGEYLRT